jgi:hypothetical protein
MVSFCINDPSASKNVPAFLWKLVLTAASHWPFSETDESIRDFPLCFFKAVIRNLFYTMDPLRDW